MDQLATLESVVNELRRVLTALDDSEPPVYPTVEPETNPRCTSGRRPFIAWALTHWGAPTVWHLALLSRRESRHGLWVYPGVHGPYRVSA